MRTPTDVQADFGLLSLAGLPLSLIAARIAALATFASDYDTAFERLSSTLHERTRRLRELEARESEHAAELERWRTYTATHADVMTALITWHTALGTDAEAAHLITLRARLHALTALTPPPPAAGPKPRR
jgi:hypothetical protein